MKHPRGKSGMPVKINNETYYRTAEVCRIAQISRSTLLRWLKEDNLGITDCRDRRSWRLFTENDVKMLVSEANKICQA
jgi:predicted site-specific integrase-resolvase